MYLLKSAPPPQVPTVLQECLLAFSNLCKHSTDFSTQIFYFCFEIWLYSRAPNKQVGLNKRVGKEVLEINNQVNFHVLSPERKSGEQKSFILMQNSKGQLISKCLFGVFTFFQKTNENKSTSSKVEFVRSFFGRNVGLKKSFRICLTFRKSRARVRHLKSERLLLGGKKNNLRNH